MSKSYIDKVYPNHKTVSKPTLLKFDNGELTKINKEITKYCAVLHKKHTKGALVVANGNVYHGLLSKGLSEELTDSYICVKNRNTNKVRIFPIDQVRLSNSKNYELEGDSNALILSKESSAHLLLKQFGGRKASRYVANQEKMQMNIDVVKEELDSTIKEASFNDTFDENIGEQHANLLRPNHNKDATMLHEIYNIDDLVPVSLIERLDEEAKVVHATSIENVPIKSEFLKECLQKLQKPNPSAENMLHIKLIIYMDALLNMMTTRVRLFSKIEMSQITEKVENDIRSRFCDPNVGKTKTRTSFSNEKGLCYFLVLAALISENNQIDVNILTKELCLAKAKIIKFATTVFLKKKAGSDILALSLPSDVAPLKTAFRRKKK